MSILRCSPLLVLLLVLMGCGDGRVKLPSAPVTGRVAHQGKPLRTGRIILLHESGQAAATDLAADGTFKLAAFQGKNQVAIECLAPEQSNAHPKGRAGMSLPKSLIPERYADFGTSGLTFEVKPGKNNKADFALQD